MQISMAVASPFTILLAVLCMVALKATAHSAENKYPLEVLPTDHTMLADPLTGAKLTFLTTNTPSSSIYFHERSWLSNSSMIIFRGHRGLMGYLTETGELVVLATPTGSVGAATAAAQRNSIFCMRGNDVLELTPTIEISPDPTSNPSSVAVIERLITTLPSGGQLNVNYDDTYLSVGLRGEVPTINVINVADGQVREVCRIEPPMPWAGHLQWSRTSSNLLSFASGPDWHREEGTLDRLWVIDPDEGVPRPVHHQVMGELVTHESWWVVDQILFCGAPPAVGLVGDPPKRELSHVNVLDPKTGVVRIIGAGSWWPEGTDAEVWRRNWWHCAGSEDGRWVVADTFHGDIVLFEGTTTRPRLLTAGHRTYGRGTHPEPGWDRKDEQVIFSSHMLSADANACVATIPGHWQIENPAP